MLAKRSPSAMIEPFHTNIHRMRKMLRWSNGDAILIQWLAARARDQSSSTYTAQLEMSLAEMRNERLLYSFPAHTPTATLCQNDTRHIYNFINIAPLSRRRRTRFSFMHCWWKGIYILQSRLRAACAFRAAHTKKRVYLMRICCYYSCGGWIDAEMVCFDPFMMQRIRC